VTDQRIFEAYKPLRDHLRNVSVLESLLVLRNYELYLQFNTPIPPDVQVDQTFILAPKEEKQSMLGGWELEILVREVIINGELTGKSSETFKSWKCFSDAVNKLKKLEEQISSFTVAERDIFLELFRIAHRQFPWQLANPDCQAVNRYLRIYSFPALEHLLQQKTGLTALELYRAFFILLAHFLAKPVLIMPLAMGPEIKSSNEHLNAFLSLFTQPIEDLRTLLIEERRFDGDYSYHFSAIRAFPIIEWPYAAGQSLYSCPLPTLLFWRATGGLYFALSSVSGFDQAWGDAFQNYVGDVIQAANAERRMQVHAEESFGKPKKRTIDWIVADASGALFVECKTKRVPVAVKTRIDNAELNKELDLMASMILQVYKTIRDYRANLYPTFKFQTNLQVFPIVVTLEDTFLMGAFVNRLGQKAAAKLNEAGLPESWLTEIPYSICSVDELERMLQIVATVGILAFMNKKMRDPERRFWQMGVFMSNSFHDAYMATTALFDDITEKILPL
jgi:hypothetical protein